MRHTNLVCAMVLALFVALAFAINDIPIQALIGKERPGKYKQPASTIQLENGGPRTHEVACSEFEL